MRPLIFTLAAVLLVSSPAFADKKYSMEDLRALAKAGSWIELADHLLDIAPAKRTEEWDKLVETTGIKILETDATKDDPLLQVSAADAFTKQFPKLKKSKAFMAARAKAGIAGFGRCYENRYSYKFCTEKFLPFVETDKGNYKMAVTAGEMVARGHHPIASLPFFDLAVTWAGTKVCKAERLDDAVTYSLALSPESDKVPRAQAIAKKCFKALRKRLVKDYKEDSNTYYRNAICGLLKAKKALSKKELADSKCGKKKAK